MMRSEVARARHSIRARWALPLGAFALWVLTWFVGPAWVMIIAGSVFVVILLDREPARRSEVDVISAQSQDETAVSVQITSIGTNEIDVIRALRVHADKEFSEAKELVGDLPATVSVRSRQKALALLNWLNSVGASAELIQH